MMRKQRESYEILTIEVMVTHDFILLNPLPRIRVVVCRYFGGTFVSALV